MYYCLNCENRFSELLKDSWGEVSALVCPLCRINDYIALKPCEQCSDLKPDDLEKYCDSCKAEVDKEISAAIDDIKSRWDSELVDEALSRWIENQ